MQTPFQYSGSKFNIRNFIISHFPKHKLYAEAFGGSAAILLSKFPSEIEAYNDINSQLVNFFRTLQDPERAEKLEHRIQNTLYSYSEFCLALETLANPDSTPDDRAWSWYVSQNQGFAGCAKGKGSWGRELRSSKSSISWNNRKEKFPIWRDRLKHVQIDNRDALQFIQYWDSVDTLHYLDPPYPLGTRKSKVMYQHEQDDCFHRKLVETILELKGMVILSSYPNPIYDRLLAAGWQKKEKAVLASRIGQTRSFQSKGSKVAEIGKRTEVIYLSPNVVHPHEQLVMEESE
ncbi:MAG: DNA adenine methylase [Candidatus Ozemobacteraceae bacterium]